MTGPDIEQAFAARASGQARRDYRPSAPAEQFIVPLLQEHIYTALEQFAGHPRPGGRALDAGCGRQPFRPWLEAAGYAYTGFDVRQNQEQTVDVLGALDADLPAGLMSEVGQFDFLLCTEVLEHVAQWHAAFENFARLLAPGGKLLITCPHFYQLHEEPFDFWRPTPYALQYYAHRSGLQVVHQQSLGDAWDVLGTLLANCHPLPASRKLTDRCRSRLAGYAHRWLFKRLARRSLQRNVKMVGPLYLSNLVVMERPK